jgi:hypothetical protein
MTRLYSRYRQRDEVGRHQVGEEFSPRTEDLANQADLVTVCTAWGVLSRYNYVN